MSRTRNFFTLSVALVAALLLVACGGSSGETVTADDDPQAVLDRTFADDNAIQSATIDAAITADMGGESGGNFDIEVSGAVQGADQNVPEMDLTIALAGTGEGEDIDFDAGLILIGDEGYVTVTGETYQLDPGLLEQLKLQYEDSADPDAAGGGGGAEDAEGFLGQLDLDQILTDLQNEGTTDVDGSETVHISGTVDISEVAPRLEELMGGANTLQGLGVGVPGAEELEQLQDSVGDVTFDIYSGTDDGLLRQMDVTIPITEGDQQGSIEITLNLSDVNEEQSIEAPADARPFSDLIGGIGSGLLGDLGIEGFEDLQDLGSLGGLGGGHDDSAGGGQGGGSGQGGTDSGQDGSGAAGSIDDLLEGVPNAGQAREVIQCLRDAVGGGVPTAADIQACQEQIQ